MRIVFKPAKGILIAVFRFENDNGALPLYKAALSGDTELRGEIVFYSSNDMQDL